MLPTWAQVEPILIQGLSSGMLQNLKAESLYFLGNRDKTLFCLGNEFSSFWFFSFFLYLSSWLRRNQGGWDPCILPPPAAWSQALVWGPRREVGLGQAGPSFCALISAELNPTSWPPPTQNCPYVWVILCSGRHMGYSYLTQMCILLLSTLTDLFSLFSRISAQDFPWDIIVRFCK